MGTKLCCKNQVIGEQKIQEKGIPIVAQLAQLSNSFGNGNSIVIVILKNGHNPHTFWRGTGDLSQPPTMKKVCISHSQAPYPWRSLKSPSLFWS